MRQTTAAERNLLSAVDYQVSQRVLVEDASGVLRDLCALDSTDRVLEVEGGESVDDMTATCSLRIAREVYETSLSPLRSDSPLNRTPGGSYGPLLSLSREVQVIVATHATGTPPGTGAWKPIFIGRSHVFDLGGDQNEVRIEAADYGRRLLRTQIEVEEEYGAASGTPIQTLMRQILDRWGFAAVPLQVIGNPAWSITPYKQAAGTSVLEALRTLAQGRGWDVRLRWSQAHGAFRLTLFQLDSGSTTPVHTFGPDDLLAVRRLEVDDDPIRNAVTVSYHRTSTGKRESVTETDPASIALHGRLAMEIVEADESPINTPAEARDLSLSALRALSTPGAQHEVDLRLWWPVELGDAYQLAPNAWYDTPQIGAVAAYRWRITPEERVTTLTLVERLSGPYRDYLLRGVQPSIFRPSEAPILYARGEARITTPTATHVPVRVDVLEPIGATVRLVAVRGSAARTGGPAVGVASPTETVWTFQRGAARGGGGEVEFAVEREGWVSDILIVPITEQGRDTYPLAVEIEQLPGTATEIPVRVRVWDPYPGGTGSVTVRPVGPYGANVGPASRTLTPGASRAQAGTADFTITRGPAGSGIRRVSFVATTPGRVDGVDAIDVPAQDPAPLVFATCVARVISTSATEIEVEVTASPPGATVALVEVRGSASRIAGDAEGVAVPSGRTWRFRRGAALGGPGEVEFRATLTGATPDVDMVEIPEEGRDTVYLSTLARVSSTTATHVNVLVYVADPYPQGPDSVTVAAAGVAVGPIGPALERKLWPTADLDTTSAVAFSIERPAFGSPPGRVTFTARANGRVKDSDAVDVPAQDPEIPKLTRGTARIVAGDTTATVVAVQVTAEPSDATVRLVAVRGSGARIEGPAQGVASGSPATWKFSRGGALGGSGQAEFVIEKSGWVSDPVFAEIPEQGRDTVPLGIHIDVTATATQYVAQVFVTDPYPFGPVLVTPSAPGLGALNPVGSQSMMPTANPATTPSVTWTIQRPTAGSPPARFQVVAEIAGKLRAVDAVDVMPRDPTLPVPRRPVANLYLASTPGSAGHFWLEGDPGDAVGTMEWRTWSRLSIEPEQAPPDTWTASPLPATVVVTGHKAYERRVYAQVRVGAFSSDIVTDAMPPILDGLLGTGGSKGKPAAEVDLYSGAAAGSPYSPQTSSVVRDATGTADLLNPTIRQIMPALHGPTGYSFEQIERGGLRGDNGLGPDFRVKLPIPIGQMRPELKLAGPDGYVLADQQVSGDPNRYLMRTGDPLTSLAGGPAARDGANLALDAINPSNKFLRTGIDGGAAVPGGGTFDKVSRGGKLADTTFAGEFQIATQSTIEALTISRGLRAGMVVDGQGVTFEPAFPGTYLIAFLAGGLSHHPDLDGNAYGQVCEAINQDTNGFTARLRLRTAVDSVATQTATFSGEYAVKSTAEEAWDDRYTVEVSGTLQFARPVGGLGGDYTPSTLRLNVFVNNGFGEALRATRTYVNYNPSGGLQFSDKIEILLDGVGPGSSFRVVVVETTGNGGSLIRNAVKWGTTAAPIWRSMGLNPVPFEAKTGT